jgi:hypothetical protein
MMSRRENFEAARWTDPEREIIRQAKTRKEVIAEYRQRFPGSTRSDDAIGRQFYNAHPDKRNPERPWTPAENQPVMSAGTVEEAIAMYRALFPDSPRTDPAIRREWYELRPEMRGLIPCGRKKGSTNKTPLPGSAREKYQIPFSVKQDKRGYNNAVNLCRKWDKPYADALILRAADIAARATRNVGRSTVKPVKKDTARSAPSPVKKRAAPRKVPARKPPAAPVPVLILDDDPVFQAQQFRNTGITLFDVTLDQVVAGLLVRQIEPYEGDIFSGVGIVQSRLPGDVFEVRRQGKILAIPGVLIEIVKAPEKTAAGGVLA